MRWKEKEKKHGMVGMGERARTAREKWMDNQEHEVVMLNLSIMAGKLSDDRLVEERRTPMDMGFGSAGTANRLRGAQWRISSERR